MADPAGPAFVTLELARMRAAGLKQRRSADADLDATLQVLAEELARYSEPVVRGACREWARAEEWWPSLAELRRECERRRQWEERAERERWALPAPVHDTSHQALMERLEARYAWLFEWRAAGDGGEMPSAVRRASEGGPITHVRWSPGGPWEPAMRKAEAA